MTKSARYLLLAGLLCGVTACTSVDPRPDMARAAKLVGTRSSLSAAGALLGEGADPWNGRAPLDVATAVRTALRNNPALRTELESIAVSRADLAQSGLLPNPVLNVALRLPLQSGMGQAEASVVQDLAALLLRGRKEAAAQAELDRAVYAVSDRALRLVATTKTAHSRVVYGQRALELTRENIDLLERSIELTEGRIRAGEATKLDVNRLRQIRLGLGAELQRQEKELGKRKRELLRVLGVAEGSTEWVAQPGQEATADGLDETRVVALVDSQRLDVVAASYAVQARMHELGIAQKAPFVGIGAGASFKSEDGKQFLGPEVAWSLPVFDTGRAQVAKAGALLRAEMSRAREVHQEAVSEARLALLEVRSSEQLVQFYRESVIALAEENLGLAEQGVRSGQSDQTVLLEAQRELVASRRTLSELEADRATALVELEYAVGGRLGPGKEIE